MQRGEIPVARVASALLALVLLSLPVAFASVSKTQCDLLHRLIGKEGGGPGEPAVSPIFNRQAVVESSPLRPSERSDQAGACELQTRGTAD
jgi:hypothetical protein